MTIRRTLLATLAAVALVAPAAQARPADMYGSTAEAAAAEGAGAGAAPNRTCAAPTPATPSRTRAGAQQPAAGQPTWPVNPTPLAPPAQEPATDDDGSSVPVLPLAAGVLVVLAAALTVRYGARRANRRTRIAA